MTALLVDEGGLVSVKAAFWEGRGAWDRFGGGGEGDRLAGGEFRRSCFWFERSFLSREV